ncbi:Hypothetical predicted protein [Octopus vulgaris]|uniref:Uncharacterized protein n=1 Tax=Octopus vulgaris TaxID=6645 RepID=A0AA36BSR2_OCTVU|nr:Hypothetical predicted protein [Octopus vulgaris]
MWMCIIHPMESRSAGIPQGQVFYCNARMHNQLILARTKNIKRHKGILNNLYHPDQFCPKIFVIELMFSTVGSSISAVFLIQGMNNLE